MNFLQKAREGREGSTRLPEQQTPGPSRQARRQERADAQVTSPLRRLCGPRRPTVTGTPGTHPWCPAFHSPGEGARTLGRGRPPPSAAGVMKCGARHRLCSILAKKKKKKVFNLNLNVREAIRHIRNVVHSIIKLAQRLKNSISQGKKRRGREPGLDLDIKTQCDMVTVTGSHFLFFGPVREDL